MRASSTRWRLWPMPPSLCSRSRFSAASVMVLGSLAVHFVGGVAHRLDDVLITGAAADIARQSLTDFRLARPRVLAQQPVGTHQHTRRAESALQAVLAREAFLQRVQAV